MARKTKAQKIIAELRRKIKTSQLERESVSGQELKKPPQVELEIEKTPPPIVKKTESITFDYHLNFIKKDLFKTFLLAIFIIGFELALYWSFELGGKNLLQNFLLKKFF